MTFFEIFHSFFYHFSTYSFTWKDLRMSVPFMILLKISILISFFFTFYYWQQSCWTFIGRNRMIQSLHDYWSRYFIFGSRRNLFIFRGMMILDFLVSFPCRLCLWSYVLICWYPWDSQGFEFISPTYWTGQEQMSWFYVNFDATLFYF